MDELENMFPKIEDEKKRMRHLRKLKQKLSFSEMMKAPTPKMSKKEIAEALKETNNKSQKPRPNCNPKKIKAFRRKQIKKMANQLLLQKYLEKINEQDNDDQSMA